MNEEMGRQKITLLCVDLVSASRCLGKTFLEQMNKHVADRNVSDIPRLQECLKDMLRVHLQVNGVDFKKHLEQVMVRPFVMTALLNFLIGRNHEVFRG